MRGSPTRDGTNTGLLETDFEPIAVGRDDAQSIGVCESYREAREGFALPAKDALCRTKRIVGIYFS